MRRTKTKPLLCDPERDNDGAFGSTALRVIAGLIAAAVLASCGRKETARTPAPDPFPILTPRTPPTPRINGAKVAGVRPGAPFLFQVSATGERPLDYSALNLPRGLELDGSTGQITGSLLDAGRYSVTLRVANRFGVAERPLMVIVGEDIALTPPMGWNSWNAWGVEVSQEKVLAAARAIVASGLRDHGWTYVNVDDGWQGVRGGAFNAIQGNSKFPDMQRLADQIHEMGLKFGIYSTPWRTTFGWHIGSSADNPDGSYDWIQAKAHNDVFQYLVPEYRSPLEGSAWLKPLVDRFRRKSRSKFTQGMRTFGYPFLENDVRQWSGWGVDYLKYDWVPIDLPHAAAMGEQLRASSRDVVYTLSNNAERSLAPELSRIANSWRTTIDMQDTWESMSAIGFSQDAWARFNVPGHYNDPDMLVLGHVMWSAPDRNRLTSDEQYAHMSLWCLLSGPLLLGCDLDKLDPFTLGLLTNDEVLDIHQDPLCKQAIPVARAGAAEVYAKPLEDDSRAVGLFNRGEKPINVRVRWSDLGVTDAQTVRDLWRQKDLGMFGQGFETPVSPHGVVLVRIVPAH